MIESSVTVKKKKRKKLQYVQFLYNYNSSNFLLPSNPQKSIMATLLFTFISEAENYDFKAMFYASFIVVLTCMHQQCQPSQRCIQITSANVCQMYPVHQQMAPHFLWSLWTFQADWVIRLSFLPLLLPALISPSTLQPLEAHWC